MAKHVIYPQGPDGPGNDRIELQWQRGAYAQMATTRWAGDGDPDRGQDFLPGTDADGPLPAWAGKHLDMTRDGINHLIKQLRIMRDQTYGRDE